MASIPNGAQPTAPLPSASQKKREYSRASPFSGTSSGLSGPGVMVELLGVDLSDAVVDVGRLEREVRRGGFPDIDDVPVRTAARAILRAFLLEGVAERRVGVHRQVELGLPGRGDLVDVTGDVPGVERLVGFPAERPASRCRLLPVLRASSAGMAWRKGAARRARNRAATGSCRSRFRPAP